MPDNKSFAGISNVQFFNLVVRDSFGKTIKNFWYISIFMF